ncbi:Ldh family oxidoreductase [Enterovibrio norvegicus]|uniref:(2R)-3-sulfolactate dehydrogenase (NADP+) n=1 Tax=Enterovibrio norvegicus DSM 15893 TaxID=1121869 RepID=A0A1I5JHV4_9GAMM|nr:Ldh family oxidoreductase [Enterovibrio norvegicus]SFO72249.1 (2R)-3-sulfolactate dehydrogenase (NADP+) [Enterovibrio norvegicus DSM 15893]
MPTITISEIQEVCKTALEKHGALPWIAESVALAVAKNESRQNRICGLYYLQSYCEQLVSGRVSKDAEPVISTPKPGVVQVDAKFGFAQSAFVRAFPTVMDAAKDNGIAALAIGHSHTCTSLGYFTEQIARRGFIAIGFTNSSPIVAPPGGKIRTIGTNPVAFSVPDGDGGIAMQFDQSTTVVALGKITMAKEAGESIPEGWALDEDGNPTTDPHKALAGSLVSAGGYKGWGFGLMAELLTAGLTGGIASQFVKPLKATNGDPHDLGQYFLVIDPANSDTFYERCQQVSDLVSQDEGTRLPGQYINELTEVDVPDSLWHLALSLSEGPK